MLRAVRHSLDLHNGHPVTGSATVGGVDGRLGEARLDLRFSSSVYLGCVEPAETNFYFADSWPHGGTVVASFSQSFTKQANSLDPSQSLSPFEHFGIPSNTEVLDRNYSRRPHFP